MLLESLRHNTLWKPHGRGSYLKIIKWWDLKSLVVSWIDTKWYIVDDIFDTIARNIVKNYEDMNSTSIKAYLYRNNYQVKSGMMHLRKRIAYLTCNLVTRIYHTFNIECYHLTKLIWKVMKNSKSKQVFGKLVYHPHKD